MPLGTGKEDIEVSKEIVRRAAPPPAAPAPVVVATPAAPSIRRAPQFRAAPPPPPPPPPRLGLTGSGALGMRLLRGPGAGRAARPTEGVAPGGGGLTIQPLTGAGLATTLLEAGGGAGADIIRRGASRLQQAFGGVPALRGGASAPAPRATAPARTFVTGTQGGVISAAAPGPAPTAAPPVSPAEGMRLLRQETERAARTTQAAGRVQLAEASRLTGQSIFGFAEMPDVISLDVALQLPFNPQSPDFQARLEALSGQSGFETVQDFLTALNYTPTANPNVWEINDPVTNLGYGGGGYASGRIRRGGAGGRRGSSGGFVNPFGLVSWRI